MEKEFVPYELAVKLKELGFERECFAWYNYGTLTIYGEDRLLDSCAANEGENRPNAPLWQQAFEWFREKHGLISFISFHTKGTFRIESLPKSEIILYSYKQKYFDNNGKMWDSYKEVEKECLEKLIELTQPL